MPRPVFEPSLAPLLLAAALAVGLASPAVAGNAEDDLQAVKKAVLASVESRPRPPAEDPGQVGETRRQPDSRTDPMWLKVRIVEKAGKRARVSLNLPIGLARALGNDWPIASRRGCARRDRCGTTVGEILRALDTGKALVDIEDDEATVRVWVE